MAMILASCGQIRFRYTRPADLDFVLESENHPDNAAFVSQWNRKQHQAAIDNPDCLHLIIEWELEPAGYLIISGLDNPSGSIELLRLVVTRKGEGIGRQTLQLVKKLAFSRWKAHRLWLDVRSNNPVAHRLYLSEGFVEEGRLRECVLHNGEYLSVTILSILQTELPGSHSEAI